MKTITKLTTVIAALLCVLSLQGQNLQNGLVAYYPFNGNALDYSGNYNNGMPTGSAAPTTDQWGNANAAYNFSGTTSAGMITVPNSPSLQFTTACTFSFWLKLNSITGTSGTGGIVAGGDHCVFAKDGDAGGGLYYNTALTAGGSMNNRIGNVSMTTCQYMESGISTGQWQHFVYIMDVTEQRMYINGILVQTVPGAPNFATMNGKNLVMARYTSNWYPMNGALDEFRVYNRAITAAEVTALASTGAVSVSVTNISPSVICAGQTINVDVAATGAIANGNTYTVQISDAAGVFTYPVNIGSLVSSATTATIPCTVPEAVPSGSGYKLRVVTNTPVSIGPASTATFAVNGVLGDIPSSSTFRFIATSGGRNYFTSNVQQTWTTARTTCISNGGILANIPDAATNNLLALHVSSGSFIGYTDQVTEGTFVWEGGGTSTYTPWYTGEPNNSGNEDYGHMLTNGYWNDVNGTVQRYLFLQLNAASSNSPVCSGNALTLFGASVTGGATYQWNGPNAFSSTQQNPVIANATLADAGTYTLTITKGGCSAAVTTVVSVVQGPNNMGQTLSLVSSLTTGLMLYYPMNTNANDASGNGLNGTMIGGVTATTDRFGNPGGALQFNGVNGYVDAPDGVYFNGTDFTTSCWVKANNYANWARIFDFGNGQANNNVLIAMSSGTSGRPSAEVYNGTVSGGAVTSPTTTVGTAVWTFLTYTYSAGTARLYINGTLVAQGTQTAPQNVLRTMCYIGRSNWAGDSYLYAALDEFRLYNRVLTSLEIQNLLMEQPDAMNLVAIPSSICPNTASAIKVIGSQKGVTYQLQNAATSANVGAAQSGNCDTLSFPTGNLTANTTYQVVATGPNGCSVILSSVTVTVVSLPALPTAVGGSRCGPGSVTLSASGAPVGAVYNWYAASVGGTVLFTGPSYSTPTLSITTTYYVSIYFNGCETPRAPATATINLATAPAVDLYTGMIAHWMLDGNTADSSGRGNNAVIQWNGAYVADRLSQAAHAFQPVVGAFLDAGNPGDFQALTTQVTLSLWIYQTNPNYGGQAPLMNKWQNNGLYMGLDNYYDNSAQQQMNRVRWRINGATYVTSGTNVPYNTWHHIVCTYNGSRLKIYQNGVQTGDLAYTGVITNTITNFQIGRQANGLGNFIFEGIYDDGRVYNRALNQDEVMALYFNDMVAFSNTPVCEGNTLQLNSPFIAGATYAWTGPNGFTSSQQIPNAIPNAQNINAGVYTLILSNPNGCVSGPQTNTVVVNPLPTAAVTINDTVCGSGNAILTASGAPVGGSYAWYTVPVSGSAIVGQTTGTYTINNLTATDTFWVSIISASGCPAPTRTPVIAVYNNPMSQSMTVSGTSICDNVTSSAVTLSTSQNGVSYQAFWNSTAISAATNGNGGLLSIPINTSAMGVGTNVINIVATQAGCGNVNITDTARINVLAMPNATITPSGPTTFCSGGNVTLSVAMSASYLWSNGATTQTILVNSSGSYSVAITNAAGCVSNSPVVNVNVIAPPVATLSASGPTTFCQGDNVVLTAGGGGTYLWSNSATSSSITVTTSGNFYVIVSNGSCTDTSSTMAVTMNPAPTANITASGPLSFCSGDNVTLFSSIANGYLWSNGATTSSIVVTTSGTYTVTTTGVNGCTAVSSPVPVTVNSTPNATITASGSTTICQGDVVTLTAGGGSNYLWNNSSASSAINVGTAGTYYCIVSNGSCSDTTSSITVTVNPAPAATLSASGPLTFCTGDSVTFTAGNANSYLWSSGATTQSITATASGTYYVTVSGANGCTATSPSMTVNVVPPPTASISAAGPTSFCQGGSVTLNASGGSSYLWSTGAITSSIVANQSGTYSVQVSNGSCGVTSTNINVTVNPLPNVQFSMGLDTFFCVLSNPITLTGGSPAGGSYSGPGIIGNTFYPGGAGTGYVTLTYSYTDANGCPNSANAIVYVDLCMNVDGMTQNGDVMAYPNPTEDYTTVKWNAESAMATLEVYDETGKLVYAENVEGKTSTLLNTGGWATGIYNVRLTGNNVETIRVIRE